MTQHLLALALLSSCLCAVSVSEAYNAVIGDEYIFDGDGAEVQGANQAMLVGTGQRTLLSYAAQAR